MRLKVLVDNNTYIDQYYYGEPAVSYYIEDHDKKILLDTGYSELFLTNMNHFSLDINMIDTIVLSHGHDDHTGGLKYLFQEKPRREVSIIAHPETFNKKMLDGLSIGSPFGREEMEKKCNLTLSRTPLKVSENITFLGEIPGRFDFEKSAPLGKAERGGSLENDTLQEDSALTCKTGEGIYIITGCSHAGICNIIEYAKEVCEEERVLGVIGGFHLFDVTERVKKTINYFHENKIEKLYPCHCTSFQVRASINKVIPVKEVGVGLEILW
ncbi:MAG: MBL fold metallo-hydrolase [Spirochaetales bacterium]|nr:MBL fold metallo-hydrolase [Spirochaetales bacterium]